MLSIRRTRSATGKIKALQYVVEAMAILRNPVERLFAKAKQFSFTDREHYETLIKAHVGERYKSRVLKQFSTEEDRSLWSLYNAVTFVASHTEGLNETSRDRLLEGAADMLLVAAKV
jgi:hypothetical protein